MVKTDILYAFTPCSGCENIYLNSIMVYDLCMYVIKFMARNYFHDQEIGTRTVHILYISYLYMIHSRYRYGTLTTLACILC